MKNVLFLAVLLAACEENFEAEGTVTAGECKGSSLGKDMDTGYEPASEVTAEVSGSDILVHLIDVDANCCPDPGVDIVIDGSQISIDFDDLVSDEGCDCMCYTDFDIIVENPGSGSWNIEVTYNGSIFGTTEISN